MQHVMIAIGVAFFVVSIISVVNVLSYWSDGSDHFEILREEAHLGVFDPTFEFAHKDFGWMAYAAIFDDQTGRLPLVSVKTAMSSREGKTWKSYGVAFESKEDSILDPQKTGGEIQGVWRYEMPSLVYTPGDTGKEWKLYAYRYFWNGDIVLARQTGVIVYKYTPDPLRVPWSKEEWLFSADEFNPPRPYNGLISLKLNTLHQSLKDIVAYADPGAFFKDGILYMTLSAFTSVEDPDRIIMIASNDFGQSWVYLGNLLTQKDLRSMENLTRYSAAQIIEKDGRPYVLVTFGDKVQKGVGSFVIPVTDLKKAKLERDENGTLNVIKHFPVGEDSFSALGGGQSDYHKDSATGVMMSVMKSNRNNKAPFEITIQGHDF